jgi:hypothetical protein
MSTHVSRPKIGGMPASTARVASLKAGAKAIAQAGSIRVVALLALGGLAIPLYAWVVPAARALQTTAIPLFWLLLGQTLLYLAGVALVWLTGPASRRRWHIAELAAILVVGIALRAIVFAAPPALSPDAYRYAWDPHLVVHGFSPYTHTPLDPALAGLRDGAIWPNLRFRDAPTIYPPGAQGLFLLAYAVAPLNIYGVKAAIVLCDALVMVLTLALLWRGQLDPRRVILYWWAPIPILEFAYSAHVDAAAILWTLAALLAAQSGRRGSRTLVGVFLGLATLTKLYPLLFVVALVRRRDYGLLVGLTATVVLGYAPFLALGLGGGGFLETYFRQRFVDQGILLRFLTWLVGLLTSAVAPLLAMQMLALLVLCAVVALARLRVGLGPVPCVLALCAGWLALSPHLFPWYVAVVLPLLALVSPQSEGPGGAAPWALGLWLFVLAIPFTSVIFAPGSQPAIFIAFFLVPLAVAVTPLLTTRGRATARRVARALFTPPTSAEVRRLLLNASPGARASHK